MLTIGTMVIAKSESQSMAPHDAAIMDNSRATLLARIAERVLRLSPAVVYGIPALVALLLNFWQISTRSFTQDEGATLSASRRPLSALLHMLVHIDAVHGAYYILIHFVILAAGASEIAVRSPSVLATAVAAGVLAALGSRLAGPWAGLGAGLLFAVAPLVTADAQNARPFALATALAVIACHRFVIFVESGRRRDAVVYAVALAAAGWLDILALLVLAANAVTLLCTPKYRSGRRAFLGVALAAGVLVLPLAWLDLTQVGQVAWEKPPGLAIVATLLAAAMASALTFGVAKPGNRGYGAAALTTLALPWLVLPPVLLALAAQITPMWENRYLLFCLPALALLVVSAVLLLPKPFRMAVLVVIITAELATQPLVRPATASDDIRAVAQLLAARAHPGDAVVFPSGANQLGRRLIMAAYPAPFVHLRDIGGTILAPTAIRCMAATSAQLC
jgi:mannosyltransferase